MDLRQKPFDDKRGSLELFPLLKPKSIALVGCSSNLNRLNGRPLRYLLEKNYQGKIYPVNPKYDQVEGIKCYPSVEAIGESIDLAILIIPAAHVVSVLESCVIAKIKSVIIMSSGFAELGDEGRKVQEKIKDISRKANLPILGPNTLGAINFVDNIPLTFSTIVEDPDFMPGRLAVVSQSGAISSYFMKDAQRLKIGFSYWVATGNEASVETSSVVKYLISDESVSGILLYMEEARDAKGLIQAGMMAKQAGKPLVCIKVGRTQSGKRAAMSHTGAMTGSDAEYDAAFKKAGIVRVNNFEELLDIGVVLSESCKPAGDKVAIVTHSGGSGILIADRCEELGLHVPQLSVETQEKLKNVIPPFGSVSNPVDVTGELINSPELLKATISIILLDPGIDSIIIFLGHQSHNAVSLSNDIVDVVKSYNSIKGQGKPVIVSWMAAPIKGVEVLRNGGVPVAPDGTRAVNALARLVQYHANNNNELDATGNLSTDLTHGHLELTDHDRNEIIVKESVGKFLSSCIPDNISAEKVALTELDSKQLLKHYGLQVPEGRVVKTKASAVELAENIGYPVVAKVASSDIPHKSDAKAVFVGINNSEQMKEAFDDIIKNSKNYNSKAQIQGVLVEKMVQDAVETIVGLRWSDKFGPMVMLGMGGILVELLKDISLRIAPVTENEALEMIAELKTAKMFTNFRGSGKNDIKALAKTISTISQMGAQLGKNLLELDINPLFVLKEGHGVIAGDALAVVRNN